MSGYNDADAMEGAFNRWLESAPEGREFPLPTTCDAQECAKYLHRRLRERNVDYYFCGGFACINCINLSCLDTTPRRISDVNIVVPNGDEGYGELLRILRGGPFIEYDRSHYYFAHSEKFVKVDCIIGGWMAFPKVSEARIIKGVQETQLQFLDPMGLLHLKLSSWANKARRGGPKRENDIKDVKDLRDILIGAGKKMDLRGLDKDMAAGLEAWVSEHKDRQEWKKLDKNYGGRF
ncbi:hypothetical protein QBC46DRAFT_434811 [Diplogelasinospora grovesii]|uniref:Uncharacterized protein n=1 Tax=Diplogelasinospora grovesii TaxID=303347 RepID=A0AAN6N949_9PEZI|nr:hypothetical protein QBC46DRAFT_434811 [Diplogelasinospora grovesii]